MKKQRGRPKKITESSEAENLGSIPSSVADIQAQVVEVIKEIVVTKEVPAKQLEGYELYKALKDSGMPQGGIGQFMEDVNGTEKVYLPHASEIYAQFAQDPEGWDTIRDHLARAFIELNK